MGPVQVLFPDRTCLGKIFHDFEVPSNVFIFPDMFIEHAWEKFDTMVVPGGGYISQTCSSKFEKIYPPKGKALPSQSGRNVQCFNQNGEGGKFSDLEKSENFLPKFDELEYLQLRKIFR